MAFKLHSAVRETSLTGGTGDQVLTGSAFDASYFRFNDKYANGDTFHYVMKQGALREFGLGTRVTSGDKISRTQVYGGSNGTSLVNFAVSQTIDIQVTPIGPADLDSAGRALSRQSVGIDVHGSDIASASTINLETATGDLVDVTGTTTITAITLSDGQERTVRFTGALTLAHGSSLVLPGAANILTAAGDIAIFRGYAGGVVRCASYMVAGTDFISSTRALGSAILMTSGVGITVTSISVPPGVWDIQGSVLHNYNTGTNVQNYRASVSTLAAFVDATPDRFNVKNFGSAGFVPATAGVGLANPTPMTRIALNATTTIYLTADATFTVDAFSVYGYIAARRVKY